MNFLVETKTEYTTQLVNIITPFLYEGFKSIYEEALKVAKQNEELKTFQMFLKKIPYWSEKIINAETKRILTDSECSDIMEDLLKAVIKANIMVLTNTTPEKKNKLKINYIIEINKFIHNSYIESAKAIFQNPFLFFHKYNQLELKRNQKEAIEVIKISIIEAIRKMLPINIILKEYLGHSFTETIDNDVDNIEKSVSEYDKNRVSNLLKADEFNDDNVSYQLAKKNIDKDIVYENKTIQFKEVKEVKEYKDHKDAKTKDIINNSDSDKSQVGNDLDNNKFNKEKSKLPINFKKKKIDIPSVNSNASESYLPTNNKIEIFESYTMGEKKINIDTIKLIENKVNSESNNIETSEKNRKYRNREFNI
jgi:hypothetical protein